MIFPLFFLINFIFSNNHFSEINKYSYNKDNFQIIKAELPLDDDEENNKSQRRKYGHKINMNINIKNSGSWEYINNSKVWTLGILSPGAYAIKLEFDQFYLPEDSELIIYNDLGDQLLGPFTNKDRKINNTFSTSLIKGDYIILEYYQSSSIINAPIINIKHIIHDYTDILNYSNSDRDRNCGINVICNEAADYIDQANSLIYMIINEYTCTGSLINNARNDNLPYILTAWHCIVGETSLGDHNNFEYYFNHQSATCIGNTGSFNYSLSGSTLLAWRNENVGSDFALLLMDDQPPAEWNPFYAGWSNSEETPLISVGIHHPEDYPKRINFDDDYAYSCAWNTANTHWCLTWDDGGTAAGSSGSPLFNSDKQIIGQNTGSDGPDCSAGPDLYGKFSLSWNGGNNQNKRLMEWLDPDESGIISINGIYTNSTYIPGDINLDGVINVLDVVHLVNNILDSNYEVSGDINGDGILNILDIIDVINIIIERL